MLNQFFEVDITSRCNLNCIHCRNGQQSIYDMPLDVFRKILCDISEFPSTRKYVALSGGEPMLHPHFAEFVSLVASNGYDLHVVTNGTLITQEIISELFIPYRKNLFFAISIDGDEMMHNRIRGHERAYINTTTAIRSLTAEGFDVTVNFTLNDFNLHCIDQVFDLCVALNATVLKVRMPIECGRVSYEHAPFKNHDAYLTALSHAVALSEDSWQKYKLIVESNDPLWWRFTSKQQQRILEHMSCDDLGGCTAGWFQLFINCHGDIYPCAYLRQKMGNVSNTTLLESVYAYRDNIKRLILREEPDTCKQCQLRQYCGGCRARALANCGDMFAHDPFCPHQI